MCPDVKTLTICTRYYGYMDVKHAFQFPVAVARVRLSGVHCRFDPVASLGLNSRACLMCLKFPTLQHDVS